MDMIVVGTPALSYFCLMIAKYHTDVVAITPDQWHHSAVSNPSKDSKKSIGKPPRRQ